MRLLRLVGVVVGPVVLLLCGGCGGWVRPAPAVGATAPLSAGNTNLVFVVSEDLEFNAAGDVSASTANLTAQGLQRSLRVAPFLQESVLGKEAVTAIYALEPATHPQTAEGYPDMAALEGIQEFSVMQQTSLSSNQTGGNFYTGNNSPVYASYSRGSVPAGVVVPGLYCPNCQGIDFADHASDNEDLLLSLVTSKAPGFYVFSAPWETTRSMLANLNRLQDYGLPIPERYAGPNIIYAITIPPSGRASLATYDSKVSPPATYPVLPPPGVTNAACTVNTPPSLTIIGGVGGAVVPSGANKNEILYLVRHAEAHPQADWSDNNYVGAGEWRALDLPNALRGRISPDQVWSGDPAQYSQGTTDAAGDDYWSILVPAMTVEPYAIANDLPFHLVTSFQLTDTNVATETSNFFFTQDTFSNHKVLLGWSYVQIDSTVNWLLGTYFPNGGGPSAPVWASNDYDSMWVLTLDAHGNLTADFTQCEGIDSGALSAAPPLF